MRAKYKHLYFCVFLTIPSALESREYNRKDPSR
jgi:hypothetical protein